MLRFYAFHLNLNLNFNPGCSLNHTGWFKYLGVYVGNETIVQKIEKAENMLFGET